MPYSQNNEETVILALLEKAGYGQGRFLDIGAYDGKTFSNTLRLAELGWSGVCVEPSPTAFTGLLKVHQANPEIILVQAAVSTDGGWLDFYDSGGDAVSSSDLAHVAKWNKNAGVKFTRFALKSVSIEELFTKFGTSYDFINLDVESLNWALFQAFPWEWLERTQVICVEHDGHADAMVAIASGHGFRKVEQNAENLILTRIHA
jgi:FkbM family methyltransferase